MATDFTLPELGENIESIQVVKILVKQGDAIVPDQPVLELETDKATIEVPATEAGTVTAIHVAEGDDIKVGQRILSLSGEAAAPAGKPEPAADAGKAAAPDKAAAPEKAEPAPPAAKPASPAAKAVPGGGEQRVMLPELGENIESIQVTRVLVKQGDAIVQDQPVLELETDKATIEVPATAAGTVTGIHVAAGDDIKVGQHILTVSGGAVAADAPAKPEEGGSDRSDGSDGSATPPVPAPVPAAVIDSGAAAVAMPAAPSVRRFAREIGVAISAVTGSGAGGRVSKDDVKAYARRINTERQSGGDVAVAGPVVPPLPDFSRWGEVESRKMSVIRYKTARHMALSWSQCPHVTIFDQADITELDVLRKRYSQQAEKAGGKLTMAVMVCKIVAQALARFPAFNASVDVEGRRIILKKYVNLGVAVSTPRGLMVPVVRDADRKNMIQMAADIQTLAGKCRDGEITLEDLEGGTFTVTNLGRVCGTHFTPIINWPEVAILGMGRAYEAPTAVGGAVAIRTLLPLSLSFDHRVIDGSDGAAFMGWIKSAIEEPLVLALDG